VKLSITDHDGLINSSILKDYIKAVNPPTEIISEPPVDTNNHPSSPKLLYPVKGQSDLPLTLDLIWSSSTDPDLDPVTYILSYSEQPDMGHGISIEVQSLKGIKFYYAWTNTMMLLSGTFFIGLAGKRKKISLLLIIGILVFMLNSCGSGNGSGNENLNNEDSLESTLYFPDSITQTIHGLKPGTTYYWKVVADDGNGGVAESETHSFSTL